MAHTVSSVWGTGSPAKQVTIGSNTPLGVSRKSDDLVNPARYPQRLVCLLFGHYNHLSYVILKFLYKMNTQLPPEACYKKDFFDICGVCSHTLADKYTITPVKLNQMHCELNDRLLPLQKWLFFRPKSLPIFVKTCALPCKSQLFQHPSAYNP